MTRTIRLIPRNKHDTLLGYVFTNFQHAREWLSQEIIDKEAYSLEEVEAGPIERCPRCGGSGTTQVVKVMRRLTAREFLDG
jgi:hypothetical protein